jgi:hypothetical protein
MAARSSQVFACWSRATASARSKYASALAPSGSGDISAISLATGFPGTILPVCSLVLLAAGTPSLPKCWSRVVKYSRSKKGF